MSRSPLYTITLLFFFFVYHTEGRSQSIFQDHPSLGTRDLIRHILRTDTAAHSSIQPYSPTSQAFHDSSTASWRLAKNLCEGHLLRLDYQKKGFTLDPLLELETGRDFRSSNPYTLGIGFSAYAVLHPKFSFSYSTIFFNARPLDYIYGYTSANGSVPGIGRPDNVGASTLDYNYTAFSMSYRPSAHFEIQAGKDKNFFGDGYRSLLLSDNSPNYYFLKLNTTIWKIKYTNLFTSFDNLIRNPAGGFQMPGKYGAFHYLSMAITKKLDVSLFEAVIWQDQDSSNTIRGFDINYMNPVILYRSIEFSRDSPDNSLMGLNLQYKTSSNTSIYGQFLLDDFNIAYTLKGSGFFQDKYGYQLGFKTFDLFRKEGLDFQAELNTVRPYTYGHKSPLQNYSNLHQPLAHPIGANFREALALVTYSFKKRYQASFRLIYSQFGADSGSTHVGHDIFKTDHLVNPFGYGNTIGQGVKTSLVYADASIKYLLNPVMNLVVYTGFTYRNQHSSIASSSDTYLYIGIRSDLWKHNTDF